jgi:hypothetical protein
MVLRDKVVPFACLLFMVRQSSRGEISDRDMDSSSIDAMMSASLSFGPFTRELIDETTSEMFR